MLFRSAKHQRVLRVGLPRSTRGPKGRCHREAPAGPRRGRRLRSAKGVASWGGSRHQPAHGRGGCQRPPPSQGSATKAAARPRGLAEGGCGTTGGDVGGACGLAGFSEGGGGGRRGLTRDLRSRPKKGRKKGAKRIGGKAKHQQGLWPPEGEKERGKGGGAACARGSRGVWSRAGGWWWRTKQARGERRKG